LKTFPKHTSLKWFLNVGIVIWLLLQSGCIVISTAGAVAATAVNTTVSIAGHTAKTAVDVITPDGDDDDD